MAAGFTIAASFVCYLYILFILICGFASFRAVCCCCWLLLLFWGFCVCLLLLLLLGGGGGGTFGFETPSAFSISRLTIDIQIVAGM